MSKENENIEVEEVLEDSEGLEEENLEEENEESETEDIDWKKRALKAENAIFKNKKKAKQEKPSKKNKASRFDSQVDLLRFNGVTTDDIEQLKKIAEIENIDLIDAKNSDYFTMYKEKKEAEEKSKKASLTPSNRGHQEIDNMERIKKRVANSDKFTREDVKSLVHGK